MKEEIIWKLVYWKMELLRDGWFGKPIYRLDLKYGTYREPGHSEVKWEQKDFKGLKATFDYLEDAMAVAERVKL